MATVDTGFGAYFKVCKAPVEQDFWFMCERLANAPSGGVTNVLQWNVSLVGHVTAAQHFLDEPPYRRPEPPATLAVRSGHQGILRLVDYAAPEGHGGHGQSGIELRFFLEPLKEPVVRTNPLEVEGTNYVAGYGPGWTADQALKAMKEWPADK